MSVVPDTQVTGPSAEAQTALWGAMFESSGLLAGAFELLADDYRYLLVNPKAAEFYGLRPDQMVGRTGRELGVSEAHLARRLAALRKCWSSGVSLTREYPFDHSERAGWFLGTFSPIPGAVARVSFVLVDVTDRKAAQLEAERQQTRLDMALSAGGLGLWEFDIARDILHWDARTRELFGVSPEAAIDYATYASRLDPTESTEVLASLDAALRGENGGRYEVLHRAVGRDGRGRWIRGFGRVIFGADGRASQVFGTVQDVTEEIERRDTQAVMVAELNHRVKNNLATVQSMAAQSARRAGSLKQFMADFEGRLVSLARTHDVLTENGWMGAELSVLLARGLEFFDGRTRLAGPKVELTTGQALALALIVHELATNAAKYGALSTAGGVVDVDWSCEAGWLSLVWRETGGPPARVPETAGFGSRLIAKLAKGDLRGRAESEYLPEGIVWRLAAHLGA